jgi:hypothetical protein
VLPRPFDGARLTQTGHSPASRRLRFWQPIF